VLEDDQVFLHWQERVLEQRGGSAASPRAFFLATAADGYVSALHEWVNRHGGEPFPGQPLPPRLDRRALMDRLKSHTDHCRACSGALTAIGRWRPLVAALPWGGLLLIALVPSPWGVAAGVTLAALALLLGQRLKAWDRDLREGEGHPPRNRD
jgi:hypothetical protein